MAEPAAAALALVFLALVLWAAAIDAATRRIPNRLTYPAILLGLASALVLPERTWTLTLLGGAAMLLIFLPPALFGAGWLGMGDVKLALALGLFLAFPLAVVAALATALIGGAVAVVLLLRGRDRRSGFPYGPCLVAGAVVSLGVAQVMGASLPRLG